METSKPHKKFYFFANYFDVVVNAIFALIVAIVFIDAHSQKPPVLDNAIWLSLGLLGIIYISLILSNGRLILSFFAIPIKVIFSYIFLIAGATLISSLTSKDKPIGDRVKNGILSGLALYLCRNLVKK